MTKSLAPWSLGLLLVALACSDAGESNETGDGVVDPCGAEFSGPIDPTASIDDLEDRNALITATGRRNGSWWLSTDGTDGTTTPPADAAPPPERILGGRCDSEYAMRVTGEGFTDWGAVLSIGFRYVSEPEPIDASDFSGARFWARVGELHDSAVRVQFQDSSTFPQGGICSDDPTSTDACYNGFGTELLQLDTEWRLFEIPFARVSQRDFGHIAESLDTENLYTMEWDLASNAVFDLWIDDVWFYE